MRGSVGCEELTEIVILQDRDTFVSHGPVPDLLVAGVLGVREDVSQSTDLVVGRRHLQHHAPTGLHQPDNSKIKTNFSKISNEGIASLIQFFWGIFCPFYEKFSFFRGIFNMIFNCNDLRIFFYLL